MHVRVCLSARFGFGWEVVGAPRQRRFRQCVCGCVREVWGFFALKGGWGSEAARWCLRRLLAVGFFRAWKAGSRQQGVVPVPCPGGELPRLSHLGRSLLFLGLELCRLCPKKFGLEVGRRLVGGCKAVCAQGSGVPGSGVVRGGWGSLRL